MGEEPAARDDSRQPTTSWLTGRAAASLGKLLLLAVTAWLAYRHVLLAWLAEFGLDEFEYAHGGWLVARGGVIYVDFFEHHFPLLHQLLGVAWRILADDPTHILTLRMSFLPAFGLAVACACLLGRRPGSSTSWWTAPVLLSVPTLSAMALQLRPDVLGMALFLACLATLRAAGAPSRSSRGRFWLAAAAGFLAISALWATIKVAVYAGVPLLAALAVDLWVRWRRGGNLEGRYLLAQPLGFLAGSGFAAASIALGLMFTGSLGAWWHWAVEFSFAHQQVYPGFRWTRNFVQLLDHSAWLLPFAALGVAVSVRRLPAWSDCDWLLLAALPTTAASFVWQTAPYLYSLIPFTVVAAIFAARGVAWCWDACLRRLRAADGVAALPLVALVVLTLLVAAELRRTDHALVRLQQPGNGHQLRTLARLGEMTAPDDPVFSPWAMQVARPSAHFFYFLEAATKRLEAERLERELVPALVDAGVTVYYHHPLSERLPAPTWAYLRSHFLPHDRDLWVYGRRYQVAGGQTAGDFFAVREGIYFVSPPSALGGGQQLRIDDTVLDAPIVWLGRGPHRVEYQGDARDVSIVWMPRDGIPFPPRPDLSE